MIAHTSYAFPAPRRSRLRGLGQLTPEQQWLNANPQCVSGGNVICPYPASVIAAQAALPMSQPSPAGFLPAATTQTAQNPTYSTQITPGTPFTTTTFDLNSYMAQWAAESAAMPAAMQGQDPIATAIAVAQSYCTTEGVAGCDNAGAIATAYGTQVKAAIAAAGGGASQTATSTGTTYRRQNGTTAPLSSTRTTDTGVAARQASSTVVNPSPSTQTVTDGSSLTSPTSVTNLANGTTLTTGTQTTTGEIIPGIPNAAIFLGGGAAVVLLVLAIQR